MPSCAICRIEAPSEKHLRMHIQSKHDDRVLTCEKCEKKCIGGIKLNTHMQSHKEVTCNHCDKELSDEYDLKSHTESTNCCKFEQDEAFPMIPFKRPRYTHQF